MLKAATSWEEIKKIREELKKTGKKVVFTNGCFDILHAGHVDYLNKAKAQGDVLILGLNSDKSVKNIKGPKRPIVDENERAYILKNLASVDYVVLFDDDTPAKIISHIIPDYLIKGGDWAIENIVGRDVVEANGGEVKTIEFVTDSSTTDIIKTVLNRYKE